MKNQKLRFQIRQQMSWIINKLTNSKYFQTDLQGKVNSRKGDVRGVLAPTTWISTTRVRGGLRIQSTPHKLIPWQMRVSLIHP